MEPGIDAQYDEAQAAHHRAIRHVLSLPFPVYAEKFLRIRTKTQGLQPFRLNRGQLHLDAIAEAQLQTRGFVRIALLKARQWGGSTYVQGRYYRRVTQGGRGLRAFILTQHANATANIFTMTRRFHEHMDPRFRPYSPRTSSTALEFPKRDSSYAVATAGAKAVARSDTIQFFHGSEVAFWPNASDHMSGALQAVPAQGPDTEVFLESTAMGMGNDWHHICVNARKGITDYEFVFVPWFWFDEYRETPRKNLILTPQDEDYMQLHGLDEYQMQFRATKIAEFGGGENGTIRFMQEYPATPEEAFSTNTEGAYIEASHVLRARRARVQPYGPKIMGIDPSWTGKDRFSVCVRQGRRARHVGEWSGMRTTQSVGRCAMLIKKERPHIVFVDAVGIGAGVVDMLIDLAPQLGTKVVAVSGAESADDPETYVNKREEMCGRVKEWLNQDQPVQIDDRDDLQGDLTNPRLMYDRNNRPRIESKQSMRNRKIPSPDLFDSLGLTFAYDITPAELDGLPDGDGDLSPERPVNWRAA